MRHFIVLLSLSLAAVVVAVAAGCATSGSSTPQSSGANIFADEATNRVTREFLISRGFVSRKWRNVTYEYTLKHVTVGEAAKRLGFGPEQMQHTVNRPPDSDTRTVKVRDRHFLIESEMRDSKGMVIEYSLDKPDAKCTVKVWLDHILAGSVDELNAAAQSADLEKVKALVGANPDLVSRKDKECDTPLHRAAWAGNQDMVEFLVNQKADVSAKNRYGVRPLHNAMWKGSKDMVELLLARGADVNARDKGKSPPLLYLATSRNRDWDVMKLLLDNKADPNAADVNGNTALIKLLIGAGGGKGEPATDPTNLVALLLAHNADVNARAKDGDTPLQWATLSGCIGVVKLLLAHNADVNTRLENRRTPLFWAVANNRKEIVELLLNNKADPNAVDDFGATPLHEAAQWGRAEIVELLLTHKADVNAREKGDNTFGEYEGTPLHRASLFGHKKVIELLLAYNADVNAKSNKGWTPLYVAMRFAKDDVAKLLREHGGHE